MRHSGWILAILISALVACGGNGELTRGLAAGKIEQHFVEKAEGTYSLAPYGFDRGVLQGYWDPEGALTDRGRTLFTRVNRANIVPVTAPVYRIEVTGITDAASPAGAKEVQFTLSNDRATGPVRRFIIAGGTGTAVFRRYDDGWRVESVRFQPSEAGIELSAAEDQAMRAEQDAELDDANGLLLPGPGLLRSRVALGHRHRRPGRVFQPQPPARRDPVVPGHTERPDRQFLWP
jgi:hypothetical protein